VTLLPRFLCALLVLLLVLPAVQPPACAAMAAPEPHMMPDMASHAAPASTPHHQPAPLVHGHDCLGCIAPIDIGAYRPATTPRFLALEAAGPARSAAPSSRSPAPEPPPPRRLV
jgi:hypothetical protein